MNNRDELTALVERAEGLVDSIYPGPWIDDVDGDDGGLRVYNPENPWTAFYIWFGDMEETDGIDHRSARFVSQSRTLVPELVAALKSCLARVDELEFHLKAQDKIIRKQNEELETLKGDEE